MNDYISREDALNFEMNLEAENKQEMIGIVRGMQIYADHIKSLPGVGWVSVEEALPEYGVPVIGAVYTTDLIIAKDGEAIEEAVERCMREAAEHPRVELCYLEEDGWNGFDGFPMVCSPSYWMPLPEPPKEETK